VRRWRNTNDGARTRRFVESQLARWRGARALYREGVGMSLVELDNRITTDKRGLRATCVLVPTPGLAIRSAQWSIFLSWEASSFTKDMWHSPYVPMTVRFDASLIEATLQYVSRLAAAEPGVDHSGRAWQFVTTFPRHRLDSDDRTPH
jgi:hypothetical protein